MAIRAQKKGKTQPKPITAPEPDEDLSFEDETGATLDDLDEDADDEDGDEDVEIEVEPARVARAKNGLYIALQVVRVNPLGKLPDGSVHVGDFQLVGGEPFPIHDAKTAAELVRIGAVRPMTDRDVKKSKKRRVA